MIEQKLRMMVQEEILKAGLTPDEASHCLRNLATWILSEAQLKEIERDGEEVLSVFGKVDT